MKSQKFCTVCGCPVDDDAIFCESCGNKIEKVSVAKPKKKNRWLIGGIAGAVFAFLAGIAYVIIVLFFMDLPDLENYMFENKQAWIEIKYECESYNDESFYDGESAEIVFDDNNMPYALLIKDENSYPYHNLYVGDKRDAVNTAMKDDYNVIYESEDEIIFKKNNTNLWVGFVFLDDEVISIMATVDGEIINETLGELSTEEVAEVEGTATTEKEVAPPAEIPEYSGEWHDKITDRCNMSIVCQNDTSYDIKIDWGSSAWENTHWEFLAEYDTDKNALVYTGGKRYEEVYSETESGTELKQTLVSENESGTIEFKDGCLYWEGFVFEPAGSGYTSTSEKVGFPDADYILPYSDSVLVSEEDIKDLSLMKINYAKNEIYARHGRIFQSYELRNYFNNKWWYNGTIDGADFSDDMLSQVERDNIKFLTAAEYQIDPDGYQLDR